MAPIRNPKPFLNALLKLRLLPEAHELVQGTLVCSKCRTFKHGCKLLPQPERPARKANKGKQVRGIGNREQQPVPAPAAKVDDHLEFNLDHLAFQVLAEPAALLPGLEPRLADDDNFDFQPELDPGVVDHILALPLGMETVAVPFEYVDDHPPEQQPTLDIATVEQQSSLDIASFEQLMEFLGQYTDQEPVAGGDDYVNNLEGLAPALPEFVPNAAVVDPRPPQFGQPAAPPHFPPWAGPAFPAPVRITGVLANSVHPDCGHWF
ncbi:hypothetical protein CspeluHIS016_0803410 [Cutaneotrichosporon spelunceum]|uniref:Uncharacterized protein n=1 Tax=Cutaneotrichosporon spelunceum TaxID=1672016 RepID=A0AAD3YDZ3_9TREE|nr:hypothetical protein CspeluHIS016_0803410 [Cutaneotrichosporon spelunceum]